MTFIIAMQLFVVIYLLARILDNLEGLAHAPEEDE